MPGTDPRAPWWRRALATLALGPGIAAWNGASVMMADAPRAELWTVVTIFVALPAALMHLRRAGAQHLTRALLLAGLVQGWSLGAKPFAAAALATALVALGPAQQPLDGSPTPGPFARSWVVLWWVAAASAVHLTLVVVAADPSWLAAHPLRFGVQAAFTLSLIVGLWFMLRMRVGGLFLLGATILGLWFLALLGSQRVFGYVLWPLDRAGWSLLAATVVAIVGGVLSSLRHGRTEARWAMALERVYPSVVVGFAAVASLRHLVR
jgi:hypothetical protein